VFRGPFRVPRSAQQILVVDTTYDQATPYRSTCIDENVEAYLIDLDLPPVGTKCNQEVPFEAPQALQANRLSASRAQLPRLPQLLRARPMR
jgi:hypothetical protein